MFALLIYMADALERHYRYLPSIATMKASAAAYLSHISFYSFLRHKSLFMVLALKGLAKKRHGKTCGDLIKNNKKTPETSLTKFRKV